MSSNNFEKHHLLHSRIDWQARPDAATLRNTPALIPRIDRDVHKELHRDTPLVPLLGFHALRRTVKYFEPVYDDPLESMDELMGAMEQSGRDIRSHQIERELVRLAVWAVEVQKPYVREGMSNPNQMVIDLGEYRAKRVAE